MSRVVIVGAGPAGATLAWLLARRGISVTLLERRTDFAREFRGDCPTAEAFGFACGPAPLVDHGTSTPGR